MEKSGDSDSDGCGIEVSKESYERIGRIALSFLNGALLGEQPDVESYVHRVPIEDRDKVRQILEEVVVPLAAIPGESQCQP